MANVVVVKTDTESYYVSIRDVCTDSKVLMVLTKEELSKLRTVLYTID